MRSAGSIRLTSLYSGRTSTSACGCGSPVTGAGIAPAARVVHGYEFDKGAQKWFFLERNRWRTVLAVYPLALLALLAPALLAIELAIHAAAARGGWLRPKLRADPRCSAGLPADVPATARRRRPGAISAREFASHLTASLDSPYLPVRNGQSRRRGPGRSTGRAQSVFCTSATCQGQPASRRHRR